MDYLAKSQLKELLIRHEGLKQYPYVDTVGKITIGIGYNLTDRGLPLSWISKQCDEDIEYFHNELSKNFHWFDKLNNARKIALIDMCFMGFKKFCSFKKMLAALEKGYYKLAAEEMINSKWANQVGNRALDLAEIMEKGELNHGMVKELSS